MRFNSIISLVFLVCIAFGVSAKSAIKIEKIKVKAPFKMPAIQQPVFPDAQFNIKDFGAEEANIEKNKAAIKHAIEACHKAGGGSVVVPSGEWLSGKIHFKSNVNLHLEEGATLLFTSNPKEYLPAVKSTWEGMECYNYSPLIYAYECENVAITGKGMIRAKLDTWKVWFKRPPAHMNALKELYNMAAKDVPVEKRQMAVGENNFRPQFIQFNRCKRVKIEGIKVRNSPFWTIHLYMSKHVVVRGVDVHAHGHNNDGVDPEMTQNLLIENCIFDQGDDAIAIKAGRNQDAWRLNMPCRNIVIRNCTIKEGHQLAAIGSEISGGVENVYIHDCKFPKKKRSALKHLVFIKTNERRGGFVRNIFVERIEAGKTQRGILGIETNVMYQWRDLVPTYEKRFTKISNVHINDVHLEESGSSAVKLLSASEQPIENITVTNCSVKKVGQKPIRVKKVNNLKITNCQFGQFDIKKRKWGTKEPATFNQF
ncbi:glycoside hydrolase family 28 protein [Prolixibacteraceae bacterium JC049]|nr:glycoside hydrolase family 28 protein [Prolixibacteraceae bacterium JC049]